MKKIRLTTCALLSLAFFAPAAHAMAIRWPNLNTQLAGESKMKKFATNQELVDWLNNQPLDQGGYYFGGGIRPMMAYSAANGAVEKSAPAVPSSAVSGQAAPTTDIASTDFSQTNIQVAGVDEADIVKNDGKYVYTISGQNLYIVDAYPAAEAKVLATIKFNSRPQNMFIQGRDLIVFGQNTNMSALPIYQTMRRQSDYTFFKVFDLTNPVSPKLVRDLNFEGDYHDARLIGNYVYFLTDNYQFQIMGDSALPKIIENGAVITANKSTARFNYPNVYYFSIPYPSYNFTTLAAINISDNNKAITSEVYILPYSQSIYVSANNAYLTYTKYVSDYALMMGVMKDLVFNKLSAADQNRIIAIQAIDGSIMSDSEKGNKINQLLQRYMNSLAQDQQKILQDAVTRKLQQEYDSLSDQLQSTVIQKISLAGDKITWQAAGSVPGNVLNQYSMDESGNYFRVVTTKQGTWSDYVPSGEQDSSAGLYVLDNNLKVVGKVTKLAKGERVYAVRFMQNRAYVVTYQQVDPLFVLDLADAKNPKVLGSLQVAGFSDYLYPYDDTTLIGLGKATEQNSDGGVIAKGLKLALFDVKDPGNPKQLAEAELGGRGSDSLALGDPHAFLFSAQKNLLVIPVSLTATTSQEWYGNYIFNGAAVFKVTKTSISLQTLISHAPDGQIGNKGQWYGYDYYPTSVKRSLYIGSYLYTVSDRYLKINQLGDYQAVGSVGLNLADYDVIN